MQVQLNTRLSVELTKKLDEYAKATGKSKASIIEAALKEYLAKKEEE
jgi:predicted transcriptional regulator